MSQRKNNSSLPRISIITPSYNQVEFIEQTIKSVVNQKYPNLEYWILDGGSTDGSVAIIKRYAKKYPHIINWVSKKDKGQVDALNKGLKKITGDIVAYINGDDYYLPGTFQAVVKYFKNKPNKSWLVGNCQVTNKKLSWSFTIKHLIPINWCKSCLYLFNWINQPAVFLKRDLVNQVGSFNQKFNYAFDYDYWLRCLKQAGTPGRTKRELAVFRIHPEAKGSTNFVKQFKEDSKVVKKHTQNPLWLGIHNLNRGITTFVYKQVK